MGALRPKAIFGGTSYLGFDWDFSPIHLIPPAPDESAVSDSFLRLRASWRNLASRRSCRMNSPKIAVTHIDFTACKHMVSVLFHSPSGVLFTLPQYYALSVTKWYLALRGGPLISQGFLVARPTLDTALSARLSLTGLFTLSGGLSQNLSVKLTESIPRSNPSMHTPWFGLFRFRSPLLQNHMLFSLPPAT